MSVPARDARRLLAAEVTWQNAKRQLDKADRDRARERAKLRSLLEPGVLATAGGVEILVTPTRSGKSFRLAEYLKKHRITKSMEPFMGEGTDYDRWTVKAAAKPA